MAGERRAFTAGVCPSNGEPAGEDPHPGRRLCPLSGSAIRRMGEACLETLRRHEFGTVCLHDCYAQLWLPYYRDFLARIQELGRPRTLDEIAADVTFAQAA